MPSYVITGVSKGIGYQFLNHLSSDSRNVVVGIVRDKPATERKLSEELKARSNIHILQADITDYDALEKAVADTIKITGDSLDYLIANAGLVSKFDAYDGIEALAKQPMELEHTLLELFKVNVVGNIHLFNLFMPLILKGQAKKVIAISSGLADNEVIAKYDLDVAAPYAISKAALNTAVAKFSAQYSKDGVLFMSICPGSVEVGHQNGATEEQKNGMAGTFNKFMQYAPSFTGPSRPEDAVGDVISVMNNASIENGDGCSFVSHYGTKQWL